MRSFGYFREVAHGDPEGPSVHQRSGPFGDRYRAARYLTTGALLVGAPGTTTCAFDRCEALLEYHVMTDGEWHWPLDAAHYVERHNVAVPSDLLDHMRQLGFKPPALSRDQLRELDYGV